MCCGGYGTVAFIFINTGTATEKCIFTLTATPAKSCRMRAVPTFTGTGFAGDRLSSD